MSHSSPSLKSRRMLSLFACGAALMSLSVGAVSGSATAATTKKPTTIPASKKTATTVPSIAAKDLAIPPAPATGVVPTKTLVAAALGRYVNVFASPTAKKAELVMDSRKNFSGRHVYIVVGKQDGWLKVMVPARPNGRTGWVKMSEVGVFEHDYAIVVSLSQYRLDVYKAGKIIQTETVAIGQSKYPTPPGVYFTRELAKLKTSTGPYGAYAFGLSGYSKVLTRFGRGDGQLGIHGTNKPALLGSSVSHGCVRVSNAGITKMAKMLPQGVPVDVRA
jgi:lipoprotein-anchoring transpeptidase ErfK/SrfK